MTTRAICSIIAKNYLAQARCFATSYRQHHPRDPIFVLLVDELEGSYDPEQEPFVTIPVQALAIPEFSAMCLRYSVTELCTAVKPFFLEYLFRNHGFSQVCYFDPDVYFYASVEEIWGLLDRYGIVLLPHLSGFLDDDQRPSELDILRSGAYNLGFIGLSVHPELHTFLGWWQGKLKRDCVMAVHDGLFVDQRWMDMAPTLFSSVCIFRDPTYNVAYWNLKHRALSVDARGHYLVNGQPLKFFHFSGYHADRPEVVSIHQTRFSFTGNPTLGSLFSAYRDCLLAHGFASSKDLPYSYNSYQGIRIPDLARRAWRRLAERELSTDPFSPPLDEGKIGRLVAWLNEPVAAAPEGQPAITSLALTAWESRPDLQRAFPDLLGRDREPYLRWFRTRARIEYDLDDYFLHALEKPAAPSLRQGLRSPLRRLGVWFYYLTTGWLVRIGIGHELEQRMGERRMNRIRGFFIRPGPPGPPVSGSLASVASVNQDQVAVAQAEQAVGRPDLSASELQSALEAASEGPTRHQNFRSSTQLGLNVVGYLRDETGVGETARGHLRALHAAGFPVAGTALRGHSARKQDMSVAHLPEGHPYGINLLHVNADQLPFVHGELGPSFFQGKYNISYWAWEVSPFPTQWFDRFQYLDEVWVGSQYVQSIVAPVAPVPVLCMGVAVDRELSAGATRSALGLPEGEFVYLFAFDMLSVFERKNPLGLIEAYRRAFGPDPTQTLLVIKATRLEEFPRERRELERALASVRGILIDRYMDRSELDGLFHACDAYVSLHRSEGFGITLAEAMRLGKPTIATAFSGNVDFMNVSNSYPVGYRLVALKNDYGPYIRGSVWAEPDLEDAAAQMRRVYEDRAEAAQKGRLAAQTIQEMYGREATARRVIQRLTLIEQYRR